MKTKTQSRPQTSTAIAFVAEAFATITSTVKGVHAIKDTRRRRCTHNPPPWRPETPRNHHMTKVVSVASLRCLSRPPTIEAPKTAASNPPPSPENRHQCTSRTEALCQETPPSPSQTHIASQPEGCQICLLNDQRSACTKGRGELDSHHGDHQSPDPTTTDAGIANHRPGAMPQIRSATDAGPTSPPLQSSIGPTKADTNTSRS
jgi:hypothetical protein